MIKLSITERRREEVFYGSLITHITIMTALNCGEEKTADNKFAFCAFNCNL